MKFILKHKPRYFLRCFIITLVSLIVFLLFFNIIVDPYWVFRVSAINNFNDVKPEFTNDLRLSKPNSVCRVNPNAVILGSSRAEAAIDPEHPSFSQQGYHVYNFAMPGTGLYEIFLNLQHAYNASNRTLKLAIIGLDFFMFNANREAIVFGTEVLNFDKKRLILSSKQSCLSTHLHDVDQLLFGKGFFASLRTIKQQSTMNSYLKNGLRDPVKNPLSTGMKLVGHRLAFINNEKYYIEKIWSAGAEQRFCTACSDDNMLSIDTFDTLRNIVAFARKNNIELRFFISPTHARMLIAIKEAGLWDTMEEVKRGIVQVIAEDTRDNPNKNPIPIWDFMTFNSITKEKVPDIKDITAEMKWYWEVSHYKIATGNFVLDKIMTYSDRNQKPPSDFGVLLKVDNIELELQKLFVASRLYEQEFPEYLAEIRSTAKNILSRRNGIACSSAYKLYREGVYALEKGDTRLALRKFEDSQTMHALEALKTKNRQLPYWEAGLSTLIQKARSGKVERNLFGWHEYQDRGNLRKSEGNLEGAIADYTEAIERGPTNTALHFLRGTTYAELKKHANAIKDFKIALKLEPDNATLKILLQQSEQAINEKPKK